MLLLAPLAVQPEPVQLERRVATVEAVVGELARKSGMDLRIKREMRDEVLYVDLKPHEPRQLMALVARAASAEWTEDGATYLGRSASLRRKQERDEAAALAEPYARLVARIAPPDGTPGETSAERLRRLTLPIPRAREAMKAEEWHARRTTARLATPVGRLFNRIVRAIPPLELAQLPLGHPVRYVPRPNRRQRPLPAASDLPQYAKDRNGFEEDVLALPRQAQIDAGDVMSGVPYEQRVGRDFSALFRVRRNAVGYITFTLEVLDAKGVGTDWCSLEANPVPSGDAHALPGYAAWSERPLPIATGVPFMAILTGAEVDAGTSAKMLDPTARDPLAVLLTEPMDALVKAVGTEAIVALPDFAVRDTMASLDGKKTLGEFADALAGRVVFASTAGLLVGSSRCPAEDAAIKTDRQALRGWMEALAGGVPRLDVAARYAALQNPLAVETSFERLTIGAAGLLAGIENPIDPRLLRLYAGLAPAQRDALRQGGAVPFRQLSPAVRAALDTWIFDDEQGLRIEDGPLGRQVDATLLMDEIPPDASLSFGRPVASLVAARRKGRGFAVEALSEIAHVAMMQDRGGMLDPRLGLPHVGTERFFPGMSDLFQPTLTIAPGLAKKDFFSDPAVDVTGRPVGIAELPPAHAKDFRESYDYYKTGVRKNP